MLWWWAKVGCAGYVKRHERLPFSREECVGRRFRGRLSRAFAVNAPSSSKPETLCAYPPTSSHINMRTRTILYPQLNKPSVESLYLRKQAQWWLQSLSRQDNLPCSRMEEKKNTKSLGLSRKKIRKVVLGY